MSNITNSPGYSLPGNLKFDELNPHNRKFICIRNGLIIPREKREPINTCTTDYPITTVTIHCCTNASCPCGEEPCYILYNDFLDFISNRKKLSEINVIGTNSIGIIKNFSDLEYILYQNKSTIEKRNLS